MLQHKPTHLIIKNRIVIDIKIIIKKIEIINNHNKILFSNISNINQIIKNLNNNKITQLNNLPIIIKLISLNVHLFIEQNKSQYNK
jgi:hypothetical protein